MPGASLASQPAGEGHREHSARCAPALSSGFHRPAPGARFSRGHRGEAGAWGPLAISGWPHFIPACMQQGNKFISSWFSSHPSALPVNPRLLPKTSSLGLCRQRWETFAPKTQSKEQYSLSRMLCSAL